METLCILPISRARWGAGLSLSERVRLPDALGVDSGQFPEVGGQEEKGFIFLITFSPVLSGGGGVYIV